jgi:hypothetical protein
MLAGVSVILVPEGNAVTDPADTNVTPPKTAEPLFGGTVSVEPIGAVISTKAMLTFVSPAGTLA